MSARKQVLSSRLEGKYIAALDEVAKAQRISRSQLLREFAENAAALYQFLKEERERQKTETIVFDGNLSRWVLEHSPRDVTPEMMHLLGEVLHHAAGMKESQAKGEAVEETGEHYASGQESAEQGGSQ